MISPTDNRVLAIKSKFENLATEPVRISSQLYKLKYESIEEKSINKIDSSVPTADEVSDGSPPRNCSYLHKNDVNRTVSEPKPSLVRQTSDPGKKLHRSHAFRCDRTQKITSPKRTNSYHRPSNTKPDLKMDRKLSKERLKRLGDILDEQMRKENFSLNVVGEIKEVQLINSIPDENVPPHILMQYAQVIKPKKQEDKSDVMTDSGVSSETENIEDEKGKVKKITSLFESNDKTENYNLNSMENLAGSSETMKLERKNPHLILTDTLKKALKQPLPSGPPPKKPPRTFNIPTISENEKKDTKRKLEKLEQVLMKREAKKDNIYDIAEENLSLKRPKEVHYLCTEILDITQRTLLPNQNESALKNCFNKLNCVANHSMSSLPYTRLSSGLDSNRNSFQKCCACSDDSLNITSFVNNKCSKCQVNDEKHGFKCHLDCKCRLHNCEFYDDHIYDEPFIGEDKSERRNEYGMLNKVSASKSMEDLRPKEKTEAAIYDIPSDQRSSTPDPYFPMAKHDHNSTQDSATMAESASESRSKANHTMITPKVAKNYHISAPELPEMAKTDETPLHLPDSDPTSPKMAKTEFFKLLQNFENGIPEKTPAKETPTPSKLSPKCLDVNFVPKTLADMESFRKTSKLSLNSADSPKSQKKRTAKVSKGVELSPASEKVSRASEKLSPASEKLSPASKKLSPASESSLASELSPANLSPSSEDPKPLNVEVKFAKNRKYHTEMTRFKLNRAGYSLPRKNPQLDVDRENLNALMNEIYETVTAACDMEDNKPGSFPTDQADGSTSEESVKLTRSLTEKRKNYVRRVSTRLAYLEPKSIKTPRVRHQTSICSFKSDVLRADSDKYNTFRSWKSFRASQNNLASKMDSDSKFNLTDSSGNILSMKNDFDLSDNSIDTLSIDEKAGCVDIDLPFEPREKGLFNICLLVGLNYMTCLAYVKSVFPSQVQVPQHIENLIFPETLSQDKGEWSAEAKSTQCYSFVLTDERGERSYGYCRRVLPEAATACLPLCYCLIGKYRAPGFYYKVLQEIESHHGGSDTQINNVLQQLFESDFPNPGEEITLTIDTTDCDSDIDKTTDKCHTRIPTDICHGSEKCNANDKVTDKSNYVSDKYVDKSDKSGDKSDKYGDKSGKYGDKSVKSSDRVSDKCKTMPELRTSEKFYDVENNNSLRELLLSLDGIKITTITRPLEPRAEESSSCDLLDSLGAGLLVKVFGSLLLERKLIVRADKLSALSSWLEALQAALYPFVWQQPLISCVPAEIQRAVQDAPLPILAGMLDKADVDGDTVEEGMFIDLTHPAKVLCYQGDESTILPTNCYKTLKTALQMESIKNKDRDDTKTRNVMISEAFLRFFVDILGDFWKYFSVGVMKEGDMGKGDVIFDKDAFVKDASSKQNQYFLEWFTETAMFNHFIQNMAIRYKQTSESYKNDAGITLKTKDESYKNDLDSYNLVDTPTPNFYQLFEERIHSRRVRGNVDRSGYKNALNKRVKLLKARLKDLVG